MNFPGSIRLLGERDVPLPDLPGHLGGHERLDRRSGAEGVDGVQGDPLHLFLRLGLQDERLRLGELADRRARLVRQVDHARVLGVVGDARPVERRVDLHVVAERMLDRLALEVLVRVAGSGEDVPERERVERPARVHVRLAEVGVALGVRRGQRRKRDETEPPRQRSLSSEGSYASVDLFLFARSSLVPQKVKVTPRAGPRSWTSISCLSPPAPFS